MKLSKTAWNNVIIFSVMIIILLINSTNNHLFPEDESNDELLLPAHSIILTFSMILPNESSILFERIVKSWRMTSQGTLLELNNQKIDQMMLAWQQSSGLIQADDIAVVGQEGIEVSIGIAGVEQEQQLTLYPLSDQLLVYNQITSKWLSLPAAMKYQLIPTL